MAPRKAVQRVESVLETGWPLEALTRRGLGGNQAHDSPMRAIQREHSRDVSLQDQFAKQRPNLAVHCVSVLC